VNVISPSTMTWIIFADPGTTFQWNQLWGKSLQFMSSSSLQERV